MSEEPLSIERLTTDDCVGDETKRAQLIDGISRVLRDPAVPDHARTAGLTLIGWLARRKESELPHALGVAEATRQSEARIKTRRER